MSAQWLFEKEEYNPSKDKERFLNKSIFTLLNIISRVKRSGYRTDKVPYSLNSVLKVICTFIIIISISISRNFIFIGITTIFALIQVTCLEKEDRNKVLLVSVIIPIFTLVMLIPSFVLGNVQNNIMLINKIFNTIILVNVLSYSTKWSHITRALKVIHIPDLFIWILDITIKYIVLLGEFSLWCFYSLKLRSIGVNKSKYRTITPIIGNLFFRSQQMGEEMFSAMECRGFTGEYSLPTSFKISTSDIIYLVVNLLILSIFIFTCFI